jgi:hypothetical protein
MEAMEKNPALLQQALIDVEKAKSAEKIAELQSKMGTTKK